MITEQPSFLGIIPLRKEKPVLPSTAIIPLAYSFRSFIGGRDLPPRKYLKVVDGEHVIYSQFKKRKLIVAENKLPEEINPMNIHSWSILGIQCRYRYRPDKVTAK